MTRWSAFPAFLLFLSGCEIFGDESSDHYELKVTGSYNHTIPGVESVECKLIETDPPQPGTRFDLNVTGPVDGVVPGQAFGGFLGNDGKARAQVRIRKGGTYENRITVHSKITNTTTTSVTVGASPSTCP